MNLVENGFGFPPGQQARYPRRAPDGEVLLAGKSPEEKIFGGPPVGQNSLFFVSCMPKLANIGNDRGWRIS